jgi:ADP-ribose pyrophosphatase YjhB (NUDIX family)
VTRRIDFYNDPQASAANSLVPSVNVVVTNEAGHILLIHRSDNDNWALPGGAIDLGESIPAAAVRETLEETGITCEITGLVGTYSDPTTSSSTPATARSGRSLHRPHRPSHQRRANLKHGVPRRPMGTARRPYELPHGSLHETAHQPLPPGGRKSEAIHRLTRSQPFRPTSSLNRSRATSER